MMMTAPVPGYYYVIPPELVPYDPSVYHAVIDIAETAGYDGGGPDYGMLCQPRRCDREQLVRGTPASLPGAFTLCQNCKRRLHPDVVIPDDMIPDDD